MVRACFISMLALGLSGANVRAQQIYIGPGSTPEGDYLRAMGIAASGLGAYNQQTAIADQINANTMIMLNEYMWSAAKNENLENAARRNAARARNAENYKKRQDRIRDNPDAIDVQNGNALNAKLWELLDPKISDSESRYAKVPLDPQIVRRIPFQIAEKGQTFSMRRLLLKGKWPVAFQDPKCANLRRAYERAVDKALELAFDGKMKDSAIHEIDKSIDEIESYLTSSPHLADKQHQMETSEARQHVTRLRRIVKAFQIETIQTVLKEIDSYDGTTVEDFRLFVRKYKLTFAPAESPEEKAIYPQLYTALLEHRNKLIGDEKTSEK